MQVARSSKYLTSGIVTLLHLVNSSSPITCTAYTLLCSTISSSRSEEKKSSRTSTGEAEMGTVGPTGEVKD